MKPTKNQRDVLAQFKGPGFGTATEDWERLKLEVLLDIKELLIELLPHKERE